MTPDEPTPNNAVQNELAHFRDAAVELLEDDMWDFVQEYGETGWVDIQCPRGHAMVKSRLVAVWLYGSHLTVEDAEYVRGYVDGVESGHVGDYQSVQVQLAHRGRGVTSAVPVDQFPGDDPSMEDRVRLACPKRGCKYAAAWTQAKLIVLTAGALEDGRTIIMLPS